MSKAPAPINTPLEYGGSLKINHPAWVEWLQSVFSTVIVVSSGANSNLAVITVDTVLDDSYYFVEADGTLTITLPNAIFFPGKQYVIKKIGTGTLTVDTTDGQNIDGELSLTITYPNVALMVESNGVNWKII